jgi:hypothetical protein
VMTYRFPRGKPTHNEYKKLVNWNILVTKFKKSTESLLVVASESGLGLKIFNIYVEKTEKVLQNRVKVL